jgi:hypothetical protein
VAGFQEALGIDTVGLIAPAIGFDVLGGDDDGVVPGRDGLAGPEVRGATGFEQHGGGRVLREECDKLGPRQSMPGDDAVVVIGDGDLEHGLCQVDGKDIRLHAWTPSVQVHSMVNTRMLAHRDAEKEREESISSLQVNLVVMWQSLIPDTG